MRQILPISFGLLLIVSCGSRPSSLRDRHFGDSGRRTTTSEGNSTTSTMRKGTAITSGKTFKLSVSNAAMASRIRSFINDWYGAPYRFGGTTKSGVDCSALMQHYYREVYNVSILRTTKLQYNQGISVRLTDLKIGDLVFFNTQRRGSGVSHVGVYMGNNKFLHASTSRGVVLSDLSSSYYQKRVVGARRLIQ